jgi:hypothetical protein
MRTPPALLAAIAAIATVLAASPASAIGVGIAKTTNPGWPSYYPNPNAAAALRFEEVYYTCQAFHCQYGDVVRVGGVNNTCP